MAGRGRPKKEDALVRDLTSIPKLGNVVSKDYIIPNHSGNHQAGRMLRTPVLDTDLVNKEYVDNALPLANHSYDFFISLPNAVFDAGTEQIAIAETLADITVTRVKVQLDISTQQLDADLKYASDFINLTSPTTINSMDTTSGVLDDTTITSASVASGKVIYMDINTIPHEDIKGMWVHIEWDYD
jgi:hypothetical protein